VGRVAPLLYVFQDDVRSNEHEEVKEKFLGRFLDGELEEPLHIAHHLAGQAWKGKAAGTKGVIYLHWSQMC
jgi:hypothetical protein